MKSADGNAPPFGAPDGLHVYDVEHAIGEPCPVVALLYMHFGPEVGAFLLWNETCFPFDDGVAWEQAKELVRKAGLLQH